MKIKHRVLVVDDNHDGADTLTTLLTLLGVKAKAVYDAETAVRLLYTFRPNVIIADLNMPDMNGDDLARLIRADDTHRDTLLIALTGYDSPETDSGLAAAGFDRLFHKPASAADLMRVIDGHGACLLPKGR